MKDDIRLTFLGVRGSYPVPDRRMIGYGGNSAAVLLEVNDTTLIFDAGTGIIRANKHLTAKSGSPRKLHIFLTHLHSDHIQGLPFFAPMYQPEYDITLFCPQYDGIDFRCSILSLFEVPFSPITAKGIRARLTFRKLSGEDGDGISIGTGISLGFRRHPHPRLGVLIYKMQYNGRSVVYATDVESPNGFPKAVVDFAHRADILIHDSQYLDRDYRARANSRQGYGHSTVDMAVANAQACSVQKLYLFHFDPEYSDRTVKGMLDHARRFFPRTYLARESQCIKIRR